jgi:K+-transporting ATPase KdpF subunit
LTCSTFSSASPVSSPCGASPGRASGHRRPGMFDYLVSGIVSVLLLVYLGWAMFQPEKF